MFELSRHKSYWPKYTLESWARDLQKYACCFWEHISRALIMSICICQILQHIISYKLQHIMQSLQLVIYHISAQYMYWWITTGPALMFGILARCGACSATVLGPDQTSLGSWEHFILLDLYWLLLGQCMTCYLRVLCWVEDFNCSWHP